MTLIVKNKTILKLEALDEYISNLEKLKSKIKTKKDFVDSFELQGVVERYLQLAIQVIIDLNKIVSIENNLKKSGDNYEVIANLVKAKIISNELADKLTPMIGFRNILVHEYEKIDHKKVYEYLSGDLGDIKRYKKEILDFLEK